MLFHETVAVKSGTVKNNKPEVVIIAVTCSIVGVALLALICYVVRARILSKSETTHEVDSDKSPVEVA